MPHQTLDDYTRHFGSAGYTVEHYDLQLTVKLASNLLDGTAILTVRALEPLKEVALNLNGLKLSKATVKGRKLPVSRKHHRVVVGLPHRLQPGERVKLSLRYSGSPQPLDTDWGEVGWEELTDGVLISGQPVGASTWFPCNDHPSHKSSYRFEISTDAGYRAVANGELVAHRRAASRDTWIYEQREPTASYLATLQIGRYAEVSMDAGGRLLAYAVPGLEDKVRTAFARQGDMAEIFERCYGPYPFDAYKVVVVNDVLEIPLEAQGLSIFGLNHLSHSWEAQRLIAHEFAHQWFGNSLTPDRWKDIWLNEGFACFSEWVYSDAAGIMSLTKRARQAWQLLDGLEQDLLVGDPGPAELFDDRVYKRGALLLYALYVRMGEDEFFALLRDWTAQHRHGLVNTEAFAEVVHRHAPQLDIIGLLQTWLYRTELPAFPTAPGSSGSSLKTRFHACFPRS